MGLANKSMFVDRYTCVGNANIKQGDSNVP